MSRNWRVYFDDMIECCSDIHDFTAGLTYETFVQNKLIHNATIRQIEILGEAAKHIPIEVREQMPHIEWTRIAGMRDVLAHAYFSVSMLTVWDTIQEKIPELHETLLTFRNSLPDE